MTPIEDLAAIIEGQIDLQMALETAPIACIVADFNGVITWANRRAGQLFFDGENPNGGEQNPGLKLKGLPLGALMDDETAARHAAGIERRRERFARGELERVYKGREMPGLAKTQDTGRLFPVAVRVTNWIKSSTGEPGDAGWIREISQEEYDRMTREGHSHGAAQ